MVAPFPCLHRGKAVPRYSESLDLGTQWMNRLGESAVRYRVR